MRLQPRIFAVAALLLAAACGGAQQETGEGLRQQPARVPLDTSALMSQNGMSTNGMSTNGMSTNGMSTNGLTLAGLSAATLSSVQFATWFASNPTYANMLLSYLAKCALPTGVTVSYWSAGVSYQWAGELGLAPVWASGQSIPVAEQQLVSACLGAHTNKYGVHVNISVRGYQENGTPLPVSSAEASQYGNDEGCYFGNLFDGTGVYSGWSSNSPLTQRQNTSERACAISGGQPGQCSPMIETNRTCQSMCTGSWSDVNNSFQFTSCTYGGVTYRPITVRLQDSDIATCGNGVCEASEACYNPLNGSGCYADCGRCF